MEEWKDVYGTHTRPKRQVWPKSVCLCMVHLPLCVALERECTQHHLAMGQKNTNNFYFTQHMYIKF